MYKHKRLYKKTNNSSFSITKRYCEQLVKQKSPASKISTFLYSEKCFVLGVYKAWLEMKCARKIQTVCFGSLLANRVPRDLEKVIPLMEYSPAIGNASKKIGAQAGRCTIVCSL